MSRWEKVRLGDVCEIITKGTTPTTLGFSFQDEGINFIKVECISEKGEFLKDKFQYISNECNLKLKRSILKENDILFSIAGVIGRTAIVKKEVLPANINQALALIRINNHLFDVNFIKYVLNSKFIFKQFQNQKQGVAQLNISLKNISDFLILHPNLNIQKQIAAALDTISDLIDLYKNELLELDNLIKSVFYDMFGDPVRNEKGWEEKRLKDICVFIDYRGKTPRKSDSGIILITAKNIGFGYFKNNPTEYISESTYNEIMTRGIPEANDILFTTEGATLGFVTRIPNGLTKFAIGQRIITLKCKTNFITSEYLEKILLNNKTQEEIFKKSTGSSAKGIRSSEFAEIKVLLPPLILQNQFASIVEKIEEQKSIIKKGLDEAKLLFDSLMSYYFD